MAFSGGKAISEEDTAGTGTPLPLDAAGTATPGWEVDMAGGVTVALSGGSPKVVGTDADAPAVFGAGVAGMPAEGCGVPWLWACGRAFCEVLGGVYG